MRFFHWILTTALLLSSPVFAQETAGPLGYGYAKFSPIPMWKKADQSNITDVSVTFGEALPILAEKDGAYKLRVGDKTYWTSRADVFKVAAPDLVLGGDAFKATERPAMRLWSSVSMATEFLEASNIRSALPDFEEVITRARLKDVKFPVVARDVVDVMGSSSANLAGILVPLSNASVARFDSLRGAQTKRIALTFVVDASPDAVEFSLPLAERVRDLITRFLTRKGDSYVVRMVFYGANISGGTRVVPILADGKELKSIAPTKPKSFMQPNDPLIAGMEAATFLGAEKFDAELVMVISGSDPDPAPYSKKLKKRISLADPGLTYTEKSHVFVMQATPEPSRALSKMNGTGIRAASFLSMAFDETESRPLLIAIRNALGDNSERPIPETEMVAACKAASTAGFPCIFPFAPTTETKLPRPPRRAKTADWYTMVGWAVLDGLMLE